MPSNKTATRGPSTLGTIKSRISVRDLPKIVYPLRSAVLHGGQSRSSCGINMQGTRRVSETTSAFESNALRHIVRRHRSLFPFPFQTPVFSCSPSSPTRHPPPLNSPYMIHEAHSSAIRWHDTQPTTVPWNHAPWSRDPRPRVERHPLLPSGLPFL